MYKDYFGFFEVPFSIVPSSRYLFLSQRHREAMQHLQAGLGDGGGFAMLTGEVGTGKTTVAKAMLASLDDKTCAGLILNPTFTSQDLLEAICDEFHLNYPEQATLKQLSQCIYQFLQLNDSKGIQTLVVIDEAQHLAADVLEQLRLLTNLETDDRKLLKVLLIGQPELQEKLRTTQLRQLSQRITGRYHLLPLTEGEIRQYIEFRLSTAGGNMGVFTRSAIATLARDSQGIPRLINLLADKSLQYAFHSGVKQVSKDIAQKASQDVLSFQAPNFSSAAQEPYSRQTSYLSYAIVSVLGLGIATGVYWQTDNIVPYLDKLRSSDSLESQSIEPLAATLPEPAFSPEEVTETHEHLSAKPAESLLPPALEQALRESTDQVQAVRELYKLWGYQASVMDGICEGKSNGLFQCRSYLGSIAQIEAMNFPVVLQLSYEQRRSYTVLYRLDDTLAELLVAGQRVQVPRAWVEQVWYGEYISIWQRQLSETLREHDQGPQVRILDDKLSQVLGDKPLGRDIFDSALKQKVQVFQRWQNMDVDGIAGKNTLKRLELLTQTEAPELAFDLGEGLQQGESQ
jgi:general secretion pathway protein A